MKDWPPDRNECSLPLPLPLAFCLLHMKASYGIAFNALSSFSPKMTLDNSQHRTSLSS